MSEHQELKAQLDDVTARLGILQSTVDVTLAVMLADIGGRGQEAVQMPEVKKFIDVWSTKGHIK